MTFHSQNSNEGTDWQQQHASRLLRVESLHVKLASRARAMFEETRNLSHAPLWLEPATTIKDAS